MRERLSCFSRKARKGAKIKFLVNCGLSFFACFARNRYHFQQGCNRSILHFAFFTFSFLTLRLPPKREKSLRRITDIKRKDYPYNKTKSYSGPLTVISSSGVSAIRFSTLS